MTVTISVTRGVFFFSLAFHSSVLFISPPTRSLLSYLERSAKQVLPPRCPSAQVFTHEASSKWNNFIFEKYSRALIIVTTFISSIRLFEEVQESLLWKHGSLPFPATTPVTGNTIFPQAVNLRETRSLFQDQALLRSNLLCCSRSRRKKKFNKSARAPFLHG